MIAGQIDLMFDRVSNSLPQVRAGNIKAFAVTAKTRLADAGDIARGAASTTMDSR